MAQGLELSVPGKTFLVGEYLALRGGPSILVTTEPRFKLRLFAKTARSESPALFHEQSPAGKFVKDHAKFFAHWDAEFVDPIGVGGFGASTAQFALAYMAELIMREGEINPDQMQWGELLRDYHLYSYSGVGEPPSGADLIAQLAGGIALYDGQKIDVQSAEWPFEEASLVLFHTGEKLATHDHLKSKLEIPVEKLRTIAQTTTAALVAGNLADFTAGVEAYGKLLEQSGFLAPASAAKLAFLRTQLQGELLAAKGCGAMGSDVLAAVVKKSDTRKTVEQWNYWLAASGNSSGLKAVATEVSISAGLRVGEATS